MGIAFSSDGARMIAGADVFDTATGQRLGSIAPSRRAWFSPDGTAVVSQQWGPAPSDTSIAARQNAGTLSAWGEFEPWQLEVVGGPRRAIPSHVKWVGAGAAAFARVGTDGFVYFADRVEPLELGPIDSKHRIASSERTLAIGETTGLVVVDLVRRVARPRVRLPMNGVLTVAVLDEYVAVCGTDGVYVAKASTPADWHPVSLGSAVQACSGKGAFVLVETAKGASVIDPRTATVVAEIVKDRLGDITASTDGKFFHFGSSVFDVDRKRDLPLVGTSPSWSPHASLLAVDRESSVAVFDPTGGGRIIAWMRGTLSPLRDHGSPWVGADLLATVHDDALTIWEVHAAKPRARIPFRAWRNAKVADYGGVQATAKLASYFVGIDGERGRETRVALVRLSDLSTLWLAQPIDGSGSPVVTDSAGAPARIEDFLR